MNCSTPDFPVLHYLLEFVQTHVHWKDMLTQNLIWFSLIDEEGVQKIKKWKLRGSNIIDFQCYPYPTSLLSKPYQWLVTLHLSFSHTQPAKYGVTSLLLIKTIKIDNQKRQMATKYESATKKQKMIMLEVKCELQVNDVTKEIADYGNRAVQKTAYATRRA